MKTNNISTFGLKIWNLVYFKEKHNEEEDFCEDNHFCKWCWHKKQKGHRIVVKVGDIIDHSTEDGGHIYAHNHCHTPMYEDELTGIPLTKKVLEKIGYTFDQKKLESKQNQKPKITEAYKKTISFHNEKTGKSQNKKFYLLKTYKGYYIEGYNYVKPIKYVHELQNIIYDMGLYTIGIDQEISRLID